MYNFILKIQRVVSLYFSDNLSVSFVISDSHRSRQNRFRFLFFRHLPTRYNYFVNIKVCIIIVLGDEIIRHICVIDKTIL